MKLHEYLTYIRLHDRPAKGKGIPGYGDLILNDQYLGDMSRTGSCWGVALGPPGFLDTKLLGNAKSLHWGSRPTQDPNANGFAL